MILKGEARYKETYFSMCKFSVAPEGRLRALVRGKSGAWAAPAGLNN